MNHLRPTLTKTTTLTLSSLALLEYTTHIPSQGRSSPLYTSLFDNVLTPTSRRLLNPENAHLLALEVVRRNLAPRINSSAMVKNVEMRVEIGDEKRKIVTDSPIGLAAGFDKDGVAVGGLFDLGFSFVEIGRCVCAFY